VMSSGSLSIFFVRPIAAVLMAVSLLFLLFPFLGRSWRAMRQEDQ
jgi:TctA family transporter